MQKQIKLTNQRGFMEISMMIVLSVIIAIVVYLMNKSEPMTSGAKELKYIDSFNFIISGARSLAQGKTDGYASVTIEELSEGEHISKSYSDGSGTNPDGGDWNLTGSSVNVLNVNATGVDEVLCTRVAEKMNVDYTATCSSGNVQVTAN